MFIISLKSFSLISPTNFNDIYITHPKIGEARRARILNKQILNLDSNEPLEVDSDAPSGSVPLFIGQRVKRRSDPSNGSRKLVSALESVFGHEAFRYSLAIALELDPQLRGGSDRVYVRPTGNADQLSDPAVFAYLEVVEVTVLARLEVELREGQAQPISGRVLQDPDAFCVQGVAVRIARRRDFSSE